MSVWTVLSLLCSDRSEPLFRQRARKETQRSSKCCNACGQDGLSLVWNRPGLRRSVNDFTATTTAGQRMLLARRALRVVKASCAMSPRWDRLFRSCVCLANSIYWRQDHASFRAVDGSQMDLGDYRAAGSMRLVREAPRNIEVAILAQPRTKPSIVFRRGIAPPDAMRGPPAGSSSPVG